MASTLQQGAPVDWKFLLQIDTKLVGSQHDLSTLEAAVDSLLTDVTAEDPFSLSMHHYVRFMQLLQWALQCIWSLHSRDAALLAATTAACQTASAFTQALQQYAKAVHADLHAVAQNNISTAGPASEPLRIKLRPTRKMADSAYKQLQAVEQSQQSDSLAFTSHRLHLDWAALHAVASPQQVGEAEVELVAPLLPMLAYGDLHEQDWHGLSTTDCVQFIQLAQCGLHYMLQEVASLHAKLHAAQQILHKRQDGGQKLHQHCRACFRQLKQAQSRPAHAPSNQRCSALQDKDQQAIDSHQAAASGGPQQNEPQSHTQTSPEQQPRPKSPVRGSRVHCRASSGNPVQVQHMQSAQLQEAQKQPEAQPSTLQHAASGSAVRLAQAELQGAQVSAAVEQVSRHNTHEDSADSVAQALRVEQQELHHARSAVAESWTLLASSEPPTAAIAAAEPPHTEEQQVPESCALTSSFGVGTDMTGPHMTSIDLDLEALRAAERSHAEARLRAVVDDIKDRAMKDVTQRMTLTSQRSTFPKQKSAVFADEMQRHGSVHHQQLNNMQAMQHFASKSAVSDIVSHLRTSSNMSNTARSSTHLKNMHMGRPPKDAGHIIHALQPTLLHTGSSLLPQTPRSPSRLGAGMTPKKLMRLTSCVKLERQESA